MKATRPQRGKIADDYLELIRAFPLREIRSERELEQAHAVLQQLFMRDEKTLSPGESDYLGALSVLVSDYEDQRFPMPSDTRTPAQRLKYLMEQSGTTQARLMKILGVSQSLVSLLLNGKRDLTKAHILKLASHFKLDPAYFL